jgi:predicted ATPase
MAAVVPGLSDIEILTDDEAPILHLVFADHSVPVEVAGDGIEMLLRLTPELASRPRGVVLMEEPEAHQHPRAIGQTAKAVLAAVRRGIQIIVSTHSLDLIDNLLAHSGDADLDRVSVHRLALAKGVLHCQRLAGKDVAFARSAIEDDLR